MYQKIYELIFAYEDFESEFESFINTFEKACKYAESPEVKRRMAAALAKLKMLRDNNFSENNHDILETIRMYTDERDKRKSK